MKQYDKIWVPEKKQGMAFRDNEGDTPSVIVGPVICMTIEELSQLWNAGHSAGMEDAGATLKKPSVDFEAYLQSKGINIKP